MTFYFPLSVFLETSWRRFQYILKSKCITNHKILEFPICKDEKWDIILTLSVSFCGKNQSPGSSDGRVLGPCVCTPRGSDQDLKIGRENSFNEYRLLNLRTTLVP